MGFFKRFIGLFKRESGDVTSARAGAISLFDSSLTTPMAVATVYRCVKLLSESVANLPVQYLKQRGDIYVEDTSHPLHYLMNVEPNGAMSAFDFWRAAVQGMILDGNAYIVPFYDPSGMELDRMVLCSRGAVQHDTLNDLYHVNDIYNGIHVTLTERDIIHIKSLTGRDPKQGVSVLAYARLATEIATAGDRETRNRFVNGGNVRGIISNAKSTHGFGEYADKQLDAVAEIKEQQLNGLSRGIVSIPGEVDFKQLSLSSTDMQFLESRKFTVREICRFFGVHPSFVFDDTSNNYKSAEQANVAFLSHTLNPLLRAIEIEMTRKLIPRRLCCKRRVTFDRRGLYASDLEGMISYRTKLLALGTSVNEVRRMENLPPVEGGDVVMVSANLRGIAEYASPSTELTDQNSNDETE